MGLLGGWWGVAAVAFVALFLGREYLKFLRGEVVLTARQKVVRFLGGIFLLVSLLMVVFSPVALRRPPGMAHTAQNFYALGYWGICMACSVMMLLMAVMDAGEISRQFTQGRKEIRRRTLNPEDIERLMSSERKDHPEDIGRGADGQ